MLHTIDAGAASDRAALAREIRGVWEQFKVLHVRRPGPEDEAHAFWDSALSEIGKPALLAEDATIGSREQQRTGKIWTEVRYDATIRDAYRHSANAQPLHTDGSYIPAFPSATLMCCVRPAPHGGETVFLDSRDLHKALAEEEPELLQALLETALPHARSGDRREVAVLRPAPEDDADFIVNWNYYCVAEDASSEVATLRERLFAFLLDSRRVKESLVAVSLNSGDAVLWHDDRVLHGRSAFEPGDGPSRYLWKCAVEVGA